MAGHGQAADRVGCDRGQRSARPAAPTPATKLHADRGYNSPFCGHTPTWEEHYDDDDWLLPACSASRR